MRLDQVALKAKVITEDGAGSIKAVERDFTGARGRPATFLKVQLRNEKGGFGAINRYALNAVRLIVPTITKSVDVPVAEGEEEDSPEA